MSSLLATTASADYLVGTIIGEGSFGRVIHCKHKSTVRDVAIKVVEKVSLRKRPDALQAVLREQRILKQLRALPSIVNLWASFHDKECVYLVMECAKGGNLNDLIAQQKHLHPESILTTDTWLSAAAHYCLQILEGLEEIHSHNIVHADLKPENILLTDRGRIQIADFGSAIVGDKGGTSTVTEMQHIFGTADYASPESLRGLSSGQKYLNDCLNAVDMWSYGCILYAMVESESPFHSECDVLAVNKIFQYAKHQSVDTRSALLFHDKSFPELWKPLILGLLHPDPAQRTGTYHHNLKPPPGQPPLSKRDSLNWYGWIKEDNLWQGIELDDEPAVLPNQPCWLQKSKEIGMRDGAIGWSVFLI